MAGLIKEPIVDEDINEYGWAYTEEEVFGVFEAFDDIPKNAGAYRAIAILLKHFGHYEAALKQVDLALGLAPDDTSTAEVTLLSIQINLDLESWEKARDMARSMLDSTSSMPPKLLRQYLVACAQAEAGAESLEMAIQSYAEAEKADPEEPMPGDLLHEEIKVIQRKNDPYETIKVIKSWKPMERFTWMTWDYWNAMWFHEDFRRAAGRCGQQDFMVQSYQEVIMLLDRLDSSAPLKYELAVAHYRVREDLEAAKSLLNEILDKPSTGQLYALTNEDPANLLPLAISFMASLNYEQFRRTRDPTIKMSLYLETKELTQKKLAQSIAVSRGGLLHHSLIVARMARKMIGAQEFYNVLNETFSRCYEALTDKVGWNDAEVCLTLGVVLSRLEGLEEEARIAISCILAELGTDEEDGENDKQGGEVINGAKEDAGEKDAGEEDDDTNDADEGDLSGIQFYCDGDCDPNVEWEKWKDNQIYVCLTCDKVILCESCHAKRLSYNKGAESQVGATYCGKDHEYIVGPLPGWNGIKDGVMRIEGREDVKFRDWLDDLKERKWKEAWDRFWLAED